MSENDERAATADALRAQIYEMEASGGLTPLGAADMRRMYGLSQPWETPDDSCPLTRDEAQQVLDWFDDHVKSGIDMRWHTSCTRIADRLRGWVQDTK